MKRILKSILLFCVTATASQVVAQSQKIYITTADKFISINGHPITTKSILADYTRALGASDRVEKKAKQINYVYDSLGIVLETIAGSEFVLMKVFVGAAATVKEPAKSYSGTLVLNDAKILSTQTLAQIQAKTTGLKWVETAGVGMVYKDKTFVVGVDAKGGKASRFYFSLN